MTAQVDRMGGARKIEADLAKLFVRPNLSRRHVGLVLANCCIAAGPGSTLVAFAMS